VAVPPGLAGILHDGPPVVPRLASSVLLIDHRADPWTLLMMRRPHGAEFAPNAYVFPGGSEHPEDAASSDPHRLAAVRELFEEAGILLARRRDGRLARDADCGSVRARLAGGAAFTEAIQATGLVPALDRLAFLARWITPAVVRRRYDTRFYVARSPGGQTPIAQPGEVEDLLWISPAGALADGGPTLVHATRRILESVVDESDPSRLISKLRRRRGESPPVVPVVEPAADGSGFRVTDSGPRRAAPAG
jgi:8-oxo-dGTP pyrophosphatase MutT (NUDIX family)